jgi:hypothetical protein
LRAFVRDVRTFVSDQSAETIQTLAAITELLPGFKSGGIDPVYNTRT